MTNGTLSWERNTNGIKIAAERKKQEAFTRADQAIKQLLKDKKNVNFETVAETGNVTRAWLYKQPDLRSRIETLRAQQTGKHQIPTEQKASDKSKDSMIIALRQQLKQIREENQQLKRQIEVAYGLNQGLEALESENRELKRHSQKLLNLLNEARAEIHVFRDISILE